MRGFALVLLVVSLLTPNLSAQIASVKEDEPQFDESTHTWQEVIENHDFRSIIAAHATFHCESISAEPSRKNVFPEMTGEYDALALFIVFQHPGNLPPGLGVQINAADPSACKGGVDGLIFSNGQVQGNLRWVNQHQASWRGIQVGIATVRPLIAKIADGKLSLTEVADDLRHRMEMIPEGPVPMNGTFNWSQMSERGVYVQLGSLLRGSRYLKPNSNSAQDSQSQSGEESGARLVPRKQSRKMALYLLTHLDEWDAALENGLRPSPAQPKALVQSQGGGN